MILKRLLWLPLIVFMSSVITVALLQFLSPEERAAAYITTEQEARDLEAVIKTYQLDASFIVQYRSWFTQAIQGNFGFSQVSSEPVLKTIRERLPASIELGLFMYFPILFSGVFWGVLAATFKDRWFDHYIRFSSLIFWSLPAFVLAIAVLTVFYGGLGWFGLGRISSEFQIAIALGEIKTPTGFMIIDALLNKRFDLALDAAGHMLLPAFVFILVASASEIRLMRASMIEVLSEDYIRTAHAKGLAKRTVIFKHALKLAILPLVTSSAFLFVNLVTGLVIIESIFAYDGVGRWAVQSAFSLDAPATLAFGLLVSLLVSLSHLFADLAYTLIDPRIRY